MVNNKKEYKIKHFVLGLERDADMIESAELTKNSQKFLMYFQS